MDWSAVHTWAMLILGTLRNMEKEMGELCRKVGGRQEKEFQVRRLVSFFLK